MPVSQNGYSASVTPSDIGIVPFAVDGVEFYGGVRGGAVHTVLHYVASQVSARVERPSARYGCGGYSFRLNVNDPTVLSNHSSGTAIDFNAEAHPNGSPASANWTAIQIAEIHAILAEVGGAVRWGGDYTSTPDAMHFEIVMDEASLATVAAGLPDSGGGTPVAGLPPVDLPMRNVTLDSSPLDPDTLATKGDGKTHTIMWNADRFDNEIVPTWDGDSYLPSFDAFTPDPTGTIASVQVVVRAKAGSTGSPGSLTNRNDSPFPAPPATYPALYLSLWGPPDGAVDLAIAVDAIGTEFRDLVSAPVSSGLWPALFSGGAVASLKYWPIAAVSHQPIPVEVDYVALRVTYESSTSARVYYVANGQVLECWDSVTGIVKSLNVYNPAVQELVGSDQGTFGSMFEMGDGSLLVAIRLPSTEAGPAQNVAAMKVDSETLEPINIVQSTPSPEGDWIQHECFSGAWDGETNWTNWSGYSHPVMFMALGNDLGLDFGAHGGYAGDATGMGVNYFGNGIGSYVGADYPSNVAYRNGWLLRNSSNDSFVTRFNLGTNEWEAVSYYSGENDGSLRFLGVDDVSGLGIFVHRYGPQAEWIELYEVDNATWVPASPSDPADSYGDLGPLVASYHLGGGGSFSYYSPTGYRSHAARPVGGRLYYFAYSGGARQLASMDLTTGSVQLLGEVPYREYDALGNEASYPDYVADNSHSEAGGLVVRTVAGGGGPVDVPGVAAEFTYEIDEYGVFAFDGSKSTVDSGSIVSWLWTFNDLVDDEETFGYVQETEGEQVMHQFGVTDQEYEVTLTVTTDLGAVESVTHTVFAVGPTVSGRVTETRRAFSG